VKEARKKVRKLERGEGKRKEERRKGGKEERTR
jgi:hypothetical protein